MPSIGEQGLRRPVALRVLGHPTVFGEGKFCSQSIASKGSGRHQAKIRFLRSGSDAVV